ncbi:MAG: hypothetical protein ACOYM9_17175 [Bradymonadia bacterium]
MKRFARRLRCAALVTLGGCASSAPAPPEQRSPCVSACVQSRQMEARAPWAIENDCRSECAQHQRGPASVDAGAQTR